MSQTPTTDTEITLTGDLDGYDIHHQHHGHIGYISLHNNRLMMIRIHDEHQHNGYGKTAVKQLVETLEQHYDTIKTSAVISPELQHILGNLGFEPSPHDPSHWVYHA